MQKIDKEDYLLGNAWENTKKAYPHKSGTRVGCCILTTKGRILNGWNIEGLWMTSIHAEVCAITNLRFNEEKIKAIIVVAETDFFTPCGSCIDWIMQFSGLKCKVVIQNKDRKIWRFKLSELSPFYPRR